VIDLVTVRCCAGGHWLAALYSGPGGALWLRYEPRQMLDPQTFRVIPSPRPGGHADRRMAHAAFRGTDDDESWLVVSCRKCTGQFPMSVQSGELLRAVAHARAGKPQKVIAITAASLRESGASNP
jgi:hypothetical protein